MVGNVNIKPVERGMLLLDKPAELTSMQCVEKAKAMLNARKAGHSGTLDPKVTGLMLIAFNEATKAMTVLMGMVKKYEGIMKVHGPFKRDQVAQAARKFEGMITQTPPRRSAVARKPRERKVFSFEILSVREREVMFRASCEAGTYIRKLCHDMGEYLGTGAHMTALRRTGIGPFSIREAVKMEQLRSCGDACLFPLEKALERMGFPGAVVPEADTEKLRNGVSLELSELKGLPKKKPKGLFGLYSRKGALLALARVEENMAKPERVFN
jgi:H/ACA ribonucleoprotein complex subunit 4